MNMNHNHLQQSFRIYVACFIYLILKTCAYKVRFDFTHKHVCYMIQDQYHRNTYAICCRLAK